MPLGGDRIYLKSEGAELLNLKEGGKVKIAECARLFKVQRSGVR